MPNILNSISILLARFLTKSKTRVLSKLSSHLYR
jgi:hypothetical protein